MEFRKQGEKQIIIFSKPVPPFLLPCNGLRVSCAGRKGGEKKKKKRKKLVRSFKWKWSRLFHSVSISVAEFWRCMKRGRRRSAVFQTERVSRKKKTLSSMTRFRSISLSLSLSPFPSPAPLCSLLSFHHHARASDSPQPSVCYLDPFLSSKKDIHYHTVTEGPTHMNKMKRCW